MKAYLLLILAFIMLTINANTQLKAHAGADSVMCSYAISPITPHVGGSPAAR